jgi:phytoene/squalene synthetase
MTRREARTTRTAEHLATRRYENFTVLSPVLPAELRRDFATVYAFCRCLDDVADRPGAVDEDDAQADERRAATLELLAVWRDGVRWAFDVASTAADGDGAGGRHESATDADHAALVDNALFGHDAFAGCPADLFVRLRDAAQRRGLSPAPFLDLIAAFERDQRQLAYDTWEDLLSYCEQSANPVGRVVLRLGGVDDRLAVNAELVEHADRVCTGLQLANHWQDVRSDLLRLGRVYLPCAETGLSPASLREMAHRRLDAEARVRFIKAVRPLVQRTRALLASTAPLPEMLRSSGPSGGRAVAGPVWLFRAGGLAAVKSVERVGCATLWMQPRVRRLTRLRLLAEAWVRFGRVAREADNAEPA